MQRVFTEDRGNYRAGDVRDFPLPTWKNFFPDWEQITEPVESVVARGLEADAGTGASSTPAKKRTAKRRSN